jgi:uncharacterized membrane protein
MFSIKESIKYGWQKFKENVEISLFATLLILAVGALTGGGKGGGFLFGILAMVFLIIIRIGYTKIFLRTYDGDKPMFSDIFKEYELFWKYIGVSILVPLVVLGGLLLLVIPGLIWAVRFSFSPIILVDTKSGPVVSMKESYAITKGKFWKLLLFWLTIAGLNILGFLVVGAGLIVSVPVSMLSTIYVYRELSKAKAGVSPTPNPTQIAPLQTT